MISYISCHDDMCLRDRLTATLPGASEAELLRLDKLGQTVVFTSQGIPFIYAGEELFRTKQGVHNSYNSPDAINAIDWSFKNRYSDLYDYYRGLIALRKAHPAFRLGDADQVREHLEFLDAPDGVVAWRLTGHAGGDPCEEIVVVINSRKEAVSVTVPGQGSSDSASGNSGTGSPSSGNTVPTTDTHSYTVYCRDGRISVDGLGTLSGPVLTVGPQHSKPSSSAAEPPSHFHNGTVSRDLLPLRYDHL